MINVPVRKLLCAVVLALPLSSSAQEIAPTRSAVFAVLNTGGKIDSSCNGLGDKQYESQISLFGLEGKLMATFNSVGELRHYMWFYEKDDAKAQSKAIVNLLSKKFGKANSDTHTDKVNSKLIDMRVLEWGNKTTIHRLNVRPSRIGYIYATEKSGMLGSQAGVSIDLLNFTPCSD